MTTGFRERFLAQASTSLQDSSPSIAQQLRIDLGQVQSLSGNARQPIQRESCPACGSTKIESRTVTNTGKAKENFKILLASLQPSELVIFKCQSCLRSTKLPARTIKEDLPQESVAGSINFPVKKPGNAEGPDTKIQKTSSKKRAKERKSRAGLQVLLGRRNDNSEPSRTFDLMDFMSNRT